MSRAVTTALAVAAVLAAACDVNPFSLQGGEDEDGGVEIPDGGDSDDGGATTDGGGGMADAGADANNCLPEPEICDELDNDCNGEVDEGFNLDADPENCGTCGNQCEYVNAFGLCNGGQCEQGDCFPGFNDLDPLDPGCEYFCIMTNGGVEQCDGLDNDCNGEVDEGFNLDNDVDNCGQCGYQCDLLQATAVCNAGTCEVDMCNPGFHDVNPQIPGCEYGCTETNGGVEICDGVDNDCDGTVDDGNPGGGQPCGTSVGECSEGTTVCSFGSLFCVGADGPQIELCDGLDNDCSGAVDEDWDKQNDPLHCGSCDPCSIPNAVPECVMGACEILACNFGFHDLDPLVPGCEYECVATGAETCDGVDNDCNGDVDETFDFQNDPQTCGDCTTQCNYLNAEALCVGGNCQQGMCDADFWDVDGAPGCEYFCQLTNGGVETCDGLDNDCDGTIDDGDPGGGQSCGSDVGECSSGTTECIAGILECVGDVGPAPEVCDDLDNDCQGGVDEDWDKQNDPLHCGSCNPCSIPNAVPECVMGSCEILQCNFGFHDLDPLVPGCEYPCVPTGAEVCDGADNDCDGLTDDLDPDLTTPANFCATQGECAGTTPTCTGAGGWDCIYTDPDVELDGNGDLVLEETRCDDFDNDCDGGADEPFPLKNTPCAEDGTFETERLLGACRGTGTLICEPNDNDRLICDITTAGAAPTSESCNDVDDDCDGHTDEPYDYDGFLGVRNDVVGPITVGGQSIVMFEYEASRPDATSNFAGFVETRACSVNDRIPWASADFAEAEAACEAAGMRLCRVTRDGGGNVLADEWGAFCEGPSDLVYPYGNGYQSQTCNGSDYDTDGGTPQNEDEAIATGTGRPLCEAPAQGGRAHDLSGNLKEWVDDPRIVAGNTVHTLRGGSFDNHAPGLTCDFDVTVVAPDFAFPNTGFRCCARQCASGRVRCGGACVNLATSASHCGACGNACGAGSFCDNGYCCPNGTEICADTCVPAGTCP